MAYTPFTVEAWSEYAVGLVILFIRIFYRCSIIGRNWDGDDWFAAVAVFFWTVSFPSTFSHNGVPPP